MKLNKVLYNNEYNCSAYVGDIEFTSISTSVNDIDSSTLFIVLKSINFDVSKIISYIIAKSPKAIVTDYESSLFKTDIPILTVDNARKILPFIYSRFYNIDFSKMKFIGITGTNGKTTTATMLMHILKESGKKVGFIGTGKILSNGRLLTDASYSMTTPDPDVLYSAIKTMETERCEYVVMEVSSHSLYFDKVLPITFFISIFTNFSPEHMDFHKTIEEYMRCKRKLFEQSEYAILNIDDESINKIKEKIKCNVKTVSINEKSDITAKNIELTNYKASKYTFESQNECFDIKLNFGGVYNIYNSLLAIAAAIELGINPYIIKAAFASLLKIDGRLEVIEDDITVIIDYAHTSKAFMEVAKNVYSAKNNGQKLFIVFGCGGNRDSEKRPLMAKYAEAFSDFVIITSDNSRNESEKNIIRDILSGFKIPKKHRVISSREKAITEAITGANDGDIVLIIGKGHERYNIDKRGYHEFDEKEIIKKALLKRKV